MSNYFGIERDMIGEKNCLGLVYKEKMVFNKPKKQYST